MMMLGIVLCGYSVAHAATNEPVVRMLVPGFTVQELPVRLSNQNNLRFAPDGTLTSLGYDGRVWRLRDTDGDGLEDRAEPYWERSTLSVPLGMAWSTAGLYISSKGKVSLLQDTDGDGKADVEEIVASGWPATDVGSGGVDATAVTLDREGNVYFGLLGADYSNAYRLRKRSELRPGEVDWLKQHGRWREGSGPDSGNDEFTLYDLESKRGTIQRMDARTRELSTVATGIRVPVALAFNRDGDLFNTDQEGETWMPNGNPLDELNHIVQGRNYGFPPRHDRWLPGLVSEPPVVAFGPQHQSACGLVFNDARPTGPSTNATGGLALPASPGQGRFGPPEWLNDAFVAGESRGKIWRVRLEKTPSGYAGRSFPIARLSMLTMDLAISPKGDLYLCCHSGPPDWGTGPQGEGRIFRITRTDLTAPQPLAAGPSSPTEVRVSFNRPLDPAVLEVFRGDPADRIVSSPTIEFGEYVSAGDAFESLKPPYAVVGQQDSTPRGHLGIREARLEDGGTTLVLTTDPHPLPVRYVLKIPRLSGSGSPDSAGGMEIEYDFHVPLAFGNPWLAWAPTNRASSGTDSRASNKPDGDWEHGRELFASSKVNCVKCHRVRGEGGIAGPDLSNLIHRDPASVLRDIREPGATLHPDYVTYEATMRDGDVHVGFLRASPEATVRLFDAEGREVLLPRSEVTSLHPTGLSLMPTGLLDSLSEGDVRDLLTFLLHEPPTRSRAGVEPLIQKATKVEGAEAAPFRMVLVASKQDHGPGQHDYPAWQEKWKRLLSAAATNAIVETAWEWPDAAQWRSADVVVFYFWNHDWSAARYAELDAYQARGGGLALIHAAVIADKDPEQLAERIGLSAQPGRSGYRHMPFDLDWTQPAHPLVKDIPGPIHFLDEPYWPLIGDPARVTLLAGAVVDGTSRPMMWTFERGPGRVFASIPGHYFWTLDDPFWRLVCLRGIAWAGGRDLTLLQDAVLLEAVLK